jgi:hypothetical protein
VALKNKQSKLNFLRLSARKFYFGVTRTLIIKGGIEGGGDLFARSKLLGVARTY